MKGDKMKIIKLELKNNYMSSNSYLLIKDNNVVVVDPGFPDDLLFNYLKNNNLKLNKIILTHGHYDHWTGLEKLLSIYPNTKVYASSLDNYWLNNNPFTSYIPKIDVDLNNLDSIDILNTSFQIIKVPGHSKGSVAFMNQDDNYIIVGDLLFCESIGRTDLEGGSFKELEASVLKLYELNDDLIVYNGHGRPTTIGHEKKFNPFVKKARN